MAVGIVVLQVSLQCLVKFKIKIYYLIFSDGSRDCGPSGKSAVSGEI